MIIISTIAALLAFTIIIYSVRKELFNLNKTKILFYEEEIITISKTKEELEKKLLLTNEKVKLINYEKENNPNNIKLLEDSYKNKKLDEKKILEKKYAFDFEKNKKIIINNMVNHMFEEDVKNIFHNYSCNIENLEADLESFFNK
jgi:hypothetical protein